MNIYESITEIMKEIGAVGKNSRNDQQKFMFRGIDAVMNALSPALIKCKVFVVPEILEQIREERTSRQGATLIYSICKVKYTFFAEDGTNVSAVVIGEGMDSGDKATNKAMSIAFKYACFQVFCIPTEEMVDPDSECHEVTKKAAKADKKPAEKAEKEMTESGNEVIDEISVKAVRTRIAKAAEAGKNLDESALCNMLKISRLEDMTYKQMNWLNQMMDKNGV